MVLCGVTVEVPHDDVSHVGVANVNSAFAHIAMPERLRDHQRVFLFGIQMLPFDQIRQLCLNRSQAVTPRSDHQDSDPSSAEVSPKTKSQDSAASWRRILQFQIAFQDRNPFPDQLFMSSSRAPPEVLHSRIADGG